MKGRREPIHSAPMLSALTVENSPERSPGTISKLVPRRVKDILRQWLR
jgi:hypothetical protein